MKIHMIALSATLTLLVGCATLQETEQRPGGREQTMLVEMPAVVAAVDHDRRLLALKGSDGGTIVIPVASEFRDFDKLRIGDAVVVTYAEALAWQVKPADAGAPGASARETMSNPKPGQPAGGSMERAITLTATITNFDRERGTVTLAGLEGWPQTIRVKRPADLEHIHVGDLVDITYSELRALAVRATN